MKRMNVTRRHEYLSDHLLFAQIALLNERVGDAYPVTSYPPERVRFQYAQRTIGREGEGHLMFSGVFLLGDGTVIRFPFSITFAHLRGDLSASNSSLALSGAYDARGRTLAFLSILDHLERCGFIPEGSLARHRVVIEHNARNASRREALGEYDAFRRRAAKSLPYDFSLEVLAMLDAPPLIRSVAAVEAAEMAE